MTPSKSILVLSRHADRRLVASDSYRREGAVVVEVETVERATVILRQLQFDVLAVDFYGLGVGVIEFLHDLSVDYPQTRISVIGPPVDSDVLALIPVPHAVYRPTAGNHKHLGAAGSGNHCEGGLDSKHDPGGIFGSTRQEQTDLQEDG